MVQPQMGILIVVIGRSQCSFASFGLENWSLSVRVGATLSQLISANEGIDGVCVTVWLANNGRG